MDEKRKRLPRYRRPNDEEQRLGKVRSSMKNNPLLKKPELGQSFRRYSMPNYLNKNFIYGKVNYSVDGGVAEAMIHNSSEQNKRKSSYSQNFVKLNAAAIVAGLVTPKEHSHFRSVTDIKMTSPEMRKILYGGIWPELCNKPRELPPDMTFGISTRPSTPMFDVIEGKFQLKWVNDKREADLAERERKIAERKHLMGYETRTTLLRKFLPPIDVPSVWRMRKYKNVPPHLETFESPEKREAAFKKHETDAISRRGIFGHGIYEPAKI